MPHLLGYARVSTVDQHPDLQRDALKSAGCYRIFADTASGALDERPQLAKVLDQLRPGDTLVVWKLDRLGRSLRHLIDTITDLQQRDIGFRSLQEFSTLLAQPVWDVVEEQLHAEHEQCQVVEFAQDRNCVRDPVDRREDQQQHADEQQFRP